MGWGIHGVSMWFDIAHRISGALLLWAIAAPNPGRESVLEVFAQARLEGRGWADEVCSSFMARHGTASKGLLGLTKRATMADLLNAGLSSGSGGEKSEASGHVVPGMGVRWPCPSRPRVASR